MSHKSPLSVVDDVKHKPRSKQDRNRQRSWGEAISSKLPGLAISPTQEKLNALGGSKTPRGTSPVSGWASTLPRVMSARVAGWAGHAGTAEAETPSEESASSDSDEDDAKTVRAFDMRRDADKSLQERVKTPKEERHFDLHPSSLEDVAAEAGKVDVAKRRRKKAPIGTRMTMTSRVGYFQDRIISPSMVRPHRSLIYSGCWLISLSLSLDASHGYPLHWTSPESRFRDRLLHLPGIGTRTPSRPFPSRLPNLWRA